MAGYGDDGGFSGWLTGSGYSLPGGGLTVAILRQRASDYLDALHEVDLPGHRTGGLGQERAWPRTGAVAFGQPIDPAVIPDAWIRASYAAAWHEAQNPGALSVSASAAGAVKREKVDVIESEYFAGSGDAAADATVRLSSVEGLVAPFLKIEASGPRLWAVG